MIFQSQASWTMTFRSQFAQSLVDLHTQSEMDPSKQTEAFYGGGGRGHRISGGGRQQRKIAEVENKVLKLQFVRNMILKVPYLAYLCAVIKVLF